MVRIGVTGHRILTDVEKIDAGVELAVRTIEQMFPEEPLVVISALAEGADRIVAQHILSRPGARIIAVLPLNESDYVKDFTEEASVKEFRSLLELAAEVERMPPTDTREQAYDAAGRYVLENSDAIITIWDGEAAQGPAGTGDIVARARERKLPIAWVHAGNREPGTLRPTSLDDEQGKVTFENI